MKFTTGKIYDGSPETVTVNWLEYFDSCDKCCGVDIASPKTFTMACVMGSKLLLEHLANLARPEIKAKEAAVIEWAKKAGVFHNA